MPEHPSRVARIPYLNSAPYYVNWPELESRSESRWKSTALPPRQLGMAMATGQADAGLLPVADLMRLEEMVTPLVVSGGSESPPTPDRSLGIACRGRVDSVLLFVRDRDGGGRPLAGRRPSLTLESQDLRTLTGTPIALTQESSTSVRLLRLLLEVRHGIRPSRYERRPLDQVDEEFGAALVIGDQALRWRRSPPEGFVQAMDLASEWCEWTALPFVFACWCVRRDLPAERARWLGEFLATSLDQASRDLSRLTTNQPPDLGPPHALTEYLQNFRYQLGPEEFSSMIRFRSLLAEHGIPCTSE